MIRFDYSIDGSDETPDIYSNVWMPFTIKSPILLQLNLLKASFAHFKPWARQTNFEKVFLYYDPPAGRGAEAAILGKRVGIISMLNARLRSPKHSIDDECIAAVVYMIYFEVNYHSSSKLLDFPN
jgi:hypothetical protein